MTRSIFLCLLGAAACGNPTTANGTDHSDFPVCQRPANAATAEGVTEFLQTTPPQVPGRIVKVAVEGLPQGTHAVSDRGEADRLVSELFRAHVVKRGAKFVPMDYKQFRNDCEDRAEVGAAFLLASHPNLELGKIFVSGSLSVFGEITWGYHVAPLLVQRTDGHVTNLWVLDPAIDAERAHSIGEWIAAASSSSPDGTELTVHVASATSWNFVFGSATEPAHAAPSTSPDGFCADVESARSNLEKFARRSPARVNVLTHVKVGKIDPRGFVVFQGARQSYGPFAVRLDVMRRLQDLQNSGQYVTARRQRLYTDSRFGNFWRFMTGGLESVFDIQRETNEGSEAENIGNAAAPAAIVDH